MKEELYNIEYIDKKLESEESEFEIIHSSLPEKRNKKKQTLYQYLKKKYNTMSILLVALFIYVYCKYKCQNNTI